MTLAELKRQAGEIKRGDYERWAFDPRVDYSTAVGLLAQRVARIAWQPRYKEEAMKIIADLKNSTPEN